MIEKCSQEVFSYLEPSGRIYFEDWRLWFIFTYSKIFLNYFVINVICKLPIQQVILFKIK